MDYFAHAPHTAAVLEKLARLQPQVLACMHGSAWRGDWAGLLRGLANSLVNRAMALPLAAYRGHNGPVAMSQTEANKEAAQRQTLGCDSSQLLSYR
jgi:hypothetical protein